MTVFLVRPPLEKALTLADRDIKGASLTTEEVRWLHEHPLTWAQALEVMRDDVENHIAKARLAIAHLKPTIGVLASAEYLTAKHEIEKREVSKRHFLQKVKDRKAMALSLVGYDSHALVSDATLVAALLKVEILLERGDSDQAQDMLSTWLDRIEARTA
jgi:hypothetical protein